jgi:hypothetical protein
MGAMTTGLDNFASRSLEDVELTGDDERAFEEADLRLCGGICSGAESSFRGKMYWELILEATGFNIAESLTPAQVEQLSALLEIFEPDELAVLSVERDVTGGPHDADACADLQHFFRICAGRGLGLIAWG